MCCTAQKKVVKLQESQALNEADISKLLEEKADFSKVSSGKDKDTQSNMFISKCGTQFTPAIRKLYYSYKFLPQTLKELLEQWLNVSTH